MGNTKQRELILNIVLDSSGHMTAEEVYEEARKVMPSIGVATVYRNLNLLSEEGELRHIKLPDVPDVFDKTVTRHSHMLCVKCHSVRDIYINDMIIDQRLEKENTRILGYDLVVRCICNKCSKIGDIEGV